jgi:hypothetical protein
LLAWGLLEEHVHSPGMNRDTTRWEDKKASAKDTKNTEEKGIKRKRAEQRGTNREKKEILRRRIIYWFWEIW